MKRRLMLFLALSVLAVAAGVARGDDRVLLRGWGAKPNLLLLLDSGSSMTHDITASVVVFAAGADDDGSSAEFHEAFYGAANLEGLLGPDFRQTLRNGSKLRQAKSAFQTLLHEAPDVNFAFTTFEPEDFQITHQNFIYRVAVDQGPMLDGGVAGDLLRLGSAENAASTMSLDAMLPIRYGEDGCAVFVAEHNPFGVNLGTEDHPRAGDIRLASSLVDGPDPGRATLWSDLDLESRRRQRLFFHPAFDLAAVDSSTRIVEGLTGAMSWESVASHVGVDSTRPGWQDALREEVLAKLEQHPLGSETLFVRERFEIFDEDHGWREAGREEHEQCDPPHVTRIEYVQHFVLHDHDPSENGVGPSTLSAVTFVPDADCGGYVDREPWSRPLVELAIPDPATGVSRDQRRRINALLGPQTDSAFYVPTHAGSAFLPVRREHALPGTLTVVASGKRPLAASLGQAAEYFENVVEAWPDPLEECRENLVVVVTDGGDSCGLQSSVCEQASGLPPVHLVVLGDESTYDDEVVDDLRCVAGDTGGTTEFVARPPGLMAALRRVTQRVEGGRRGFGALLLPSVRADSHQVAYVTSFTPVRGRSIWRGSLLAYPVDPFSGGPVVGGDGRLDRMHAIWDAGEELARRWDWGDVLVANPFGASSDPRSIYYASDAGGSARRALFAYPGNASEQFAVRRDLGVRLFGDWPSMPGAEGPEELADLRFVIDFIRGVWQTPDASGAPAEVRGADLYGLRGDGEQEIAGVEKLGDLFHGAPQRMAAPSCLPCFSTDYRGYRDFFEHHRHRRSVLFAGANDGLMHAFDSGLWDADGFDGGAPRYDVGTGRELFAWVPSSVMGSLGRLAREPLHQWTVDGTATVADVWVDPIVVGAPEDGDRRWRTMLIWGQREGGRSYVCLDVTDPDASTGGEPTVNGNLSYREQPRFDESGDVISTWQAPSAPETDGVGERDAVCGTEDPSEECAMSWPAFRWEFTDVADENGDGGPDLGATWSQPAVAFVRVVVGEAIEDRMVSFFGGGLSPAGLRDAAGDPAGNFVYGVDVETGGILLKHPVTGMVPADVQVLDLDSDGFAEKIYLATTAGKIYRVDLEEPGVVDAESGRVTGWAPQLIFATEGDQPFFMRPTLVPAYYDAAGAFRLAVLVGSGNRDDLLENNPLPHRMYAFLEPAGGAVSDSDLVALTPDSDALDYAVLGGAAGMGWYLDLARPGGGNWEKVVTPAAVFNNIVVFSTFNPSLPSGDACEHNGEVRTYVLNLANGNPLPERTRDVLFSGSTTFVGSPVTYLGADGRVHLLQITDTLEVSESVEAVEPAVNMVDWKEE